MGKGDKSRFEPSLDHNKPCSLLSITEEIPVQTSYGDHGKSEQMIADGLKNASDRQEEAETLKKEYESALSGAKEESVKIVENARVEAKRQSDEILADADRRADATIERARKTIETERKQALDGVETQIAGLAMQAARKIVDEETRKQGNQAIYDQFLESVGDAHDGKDE